ncbi:MAG: thioesterase [Bosea sp.]|nr:thioesterase [Bosea sp. (in: a-proteobacteria)]
MLPDWSKAPALFFAPCVSSPMRVDPQWIDYNGHLNMAFYNVLFDRAADEIFGLLGLGPAYVQEQGASCFVAEVHVRYLRELMAGDPVRVTLQLVDFDGKRLHYFLELRHAEEGWVSATTENLALHVEMSSKKVTPFPADILANLALLKAAHASLRRPAALGRVIAIPHGDATANAGLAHASG